MRREEVVKLSFGDRRSLKTRRGHFFRLVGPIGFVAMMLVALLAITAYSYYSNRRDALALSSDLLGAIERRIGGELKAFLKPIEDTVLLSADFLANTSFDIRNREILESFAFRVLANLSQVSNFIVADQSGNFLMVARQRDGSLHTKIIDRSTGAPLATWIRRDTAGKVVDEETSVDDSYDPRNRPWYKGAVNSREPFWTEFYIFFTSQTHGATISLPITGQNDEHLGAFGLDVELKDISAFLESLKIGENGEAIIIDEEGYIVAHPEIKKMVKKEGDRFAPIQVDELGNPLLIRAYNRFKIEGHGHRDIIIDGRRYLSTAFLLPQQTGLDLSVFVLVPEEDFVGFVARNNRNIILMSSGVILLAAIMAGLLVYQSLRAEHRTNRVLKRQDELEAQSRAFSELASKEAAFGAGDTASYRQLTEIVADTINLRRASLWHVDEDGSLLTCIDSFDRESNGHTRGAMLSRREFSELFELLLDGEEIRSGDAEADSRLAELFRIYLQPMGCGALLAIPIRFHDKTLGALWFEEERMLRGWSDEEISFARTISNILALRFSAERQLETAHDELKDKGGDAEEFTGPDLRRSTSAGGMRPVPDTPEINRADEQQQAVSTEGATPLSPFADRMAAGGMVPDQCAADIFEDATVLALQFTDPLSLAGRTGDSKSTPMVDMMVARLEELTKSLGIEYVRILGEEIICATGIDTGSKDHTRRIADLALSLQDHCTGLFTSLNTTMKFRIGIDTGAVLGSEVGRGQKTYNIWGESVRFASQMAESGIAGGIQVSQTTYRRLRATYLFQMRGRYYLPLIGETSTYLLTGRI